MDQATFHSIVMRANLAPSIHNAQPTRWRLQGQNIEVASDCSVRLPQADPAGRGVALSVGAAVEATLLALGDQGIGADVSTHWAEDNRSTWPGHRMAARLSLRPGQPHDLAAMLEKRLTWRGRFDAAVPHLDGWARGDTLLVQGEDERAEIAGLNDAASLVILRRPEFRRELLSWMRLTPRHPRFRHDGLSSVNLRLVKGDAKRLKLGLGPLWGLLDVTGRTTALTAEAELTMTAPVLAIFHAERGACPVQTGRAYLRMWLEATQRGLAGWPMAALSDERQAHDRLCANHAIPADREIIQVLRLGGITGVAPPRTRRPIKEVAP